MSFLDLDDEAPPVAKRPRVGHPVETLLRPVETETVLSGKPRHLRAVLLHAGQPRGTESVADVVRNQADDLAFSFSTDPALVLEVLFEGVLSLPAYTAVIAALVALAARRRPALAAAVAPALADRLTSALTAGNMLQARLLLRFLASLGAAGAVDAAAVVAQLAALLAGAAAARDAGATREAAAVTYAALAALPFFANKVGTAGAGVGAGSPGVAAALTALLDTAAALVASLTPAPAAAAATALTAARAADLEGWLDVPQSRADSVPLAALAQGSLARLWDAIAAAVAVQAPASDSGAEDSSSRFCGLAPSTVARVQDDASVADALFGAPPPALAAAPAPAAEAADAAAAVPADGDGAAAASSASEPQPTLPVAYRPAVRVAASASGVAPAYVLSAAGAAPDADAEPAPLHSSMAPPPLPSGRWFVRPALTLFGPGGLTSTAAVLRTLQLAAARPVELWAVREVAHDVIATHHPFSEATAQALLALPAGACVPSPTWTAPPPGWVDSRPVPAAPVAVEAVLSQMLWPAPAPPFTTLYYGTLMLELLKVRPLLAPAAADGGAAPPPPPPAVSAVLSVACRALWKYVHVLDEGGVAGVLATWSAFHASHVGWKWMWGDMAPALAEGVPLTDPQRRFATALLQRSFALIGPWAYDKIVPDAFKPLTSAAGVPAGVVPPKVTAAASSVLLAAPPQQAVAPAAAPAPAADPAPAPAALPVDHEMPADEVDTLRHTAPGAVVAHSTGAGDAAAEGAAGDAAMGESGTNDVAAAASADPHGLPPGLAAFASGLLDQLRAKTEPGPLGAWMDAAFPGESLPGELRLLALTHAVLVHGSANFKHASTLLERYRPLLASTAGLLATAPGSSAYVAYRHPAPESPSAADDVRAHVLLSGLQHVWAATPHVVAALAGLLIEAGLLAPRQVVGWALAPVVVFPSPPLSLAPAWPPATRAPGASSASVDDDALPGAVAVERLAQPAVWSLLHGALDRAGAAAKRAAVELAMFRGDKCFDMREEELEVAAAEDKEAALVGAARAAAAARDDAVSEAVAGLVRGCRALEAHVWHLAAAAAAPAPEADGDDDAAPSQAASAAALEAPREALRLALSHLRAVLRTHAHLWSPAAGAPADVAHRWDAVFTHALGASSALLAGASQFASAAGVPLSNPDADVAAAAVAAARGFAPAVLAVAPALARDRSRAQPTADF